MGNKKISKNHLSSAVQSLRDVLDREDICSITELWTMGNRSFSVPGRPGHSIEFEEKEKAMNGYLCKLPRKQVIRYVVRGLEFPVFKIVISVRIGPLDSYISFNCGEIIPGYSVFDVDESENYHQYRHFLSEQEAPFGGNLEKLSAL